MRIIIFLLCFIFGFTSILGSKAHLIRRDVFCTRVIDGNTIVLSDMVHVRFCGINAPELGRGGKISAQCAIEARDFTSLTLTGKVFAIEFLSYNDKYGRALGWIWLPNGDLFNDVLVRRGLAVSMDSPPKVYFEKILDSEVTARRDKCGLWLGLQE